jgi:hypothetical protein
MATPELQLETLFTFDPAGRITGTREPGGTRGPLFTLIRSSTAVAFAVRGDIQEPLAVELLRLAASEPPALDLRNPPAHATRYLSLLADRLVPGQALRAKTIQSDGPAFTFPLELTPPTGVVRVTDESSLGPWFRGWEAGELASGRAPCLAVAEAGYPVSLCFSARSSKRAAEAGLETAAAHRGRGFGARVTTAWALAIRESGRTPLYSTFWSNGASLAVARKLGLIAYASDWSLLDA